MPSFMDCSGPNLKCWIPNCTFSSITQKGLTIHLSQVHNIRYRDRGRPVKGARSRRKRAPSREPPLENMPTPYACAVCRQYRCANKEDILRHVQEHMLPRDARHKYHLHFNNSGELRNPGSSGSQRGFTWPPFPYMQRPQYEMNVRPQYGKQMCDSYWQVSQMQQPRGEFQNQGMTVVHDQTPQSESFDRVQIFDAQRPASDWSQQCRSSIQTPQAMSAQFASTLQIRTDDNANGWSSQMNPQETDESNIHLWSGVDQMQISQYDSKRVSVAQETNVDVEPCSQCGCASRGGCTVKTTVDSSSDVNRIILVEEDGLGGSLNAGEINEVYHLQGGSSLGSLKASNVKQVLSQGDEIVLEYRTEDGREVLLRAVRAEPDVEDTVEGNSEDDGLTLALASSSINEETIKNDSEVLESTNFEPETPIEENETESSETNLGPTEESIQSTLPELFPELFGDNMVNSELDSVSWQSDEAEESENFFEVCKRSDYFEALSKCRRVEVEGGLMLLKCGLCSYCTDMCDSLEQLEIHIRKHVVTSFQCRNCDFSSNMREEMLVHVGTQHDVPNSEPPFR